MSFSSLDTYAEAVPQVTEAPLVTINGGGRTLKEIIKEVAVQSGYKIEISESLLRQKVTGKFVDTDIEVFFNRVLKGTDIFQVIEPENKIIKLFVTARTQERIMVVEADGNGAAGDHWLDSGLDGEPGKTNSELLQARDEAFQDYNPGEQILDGEPGKTTQDLLDDRAAAFEKYDQATVKLDGESEKTTQDLLNERAAAFEKYDPATVELDGQPGKTTQDLLDDRAEHFKDYNANKQALDGEPGKTFQDLLDERDRVFKERKL